MANYYFDTNALIKSSTLLQSNKNEHGVIETLQLIQQPNAAIFYSSLTLLETWRVLFKEYRKGKFGNRPSRAKKVFNGILTQFSSTISNEPFKKLDTQINEHIMFQAQILIENHGYNYAVGSMDMIHVALVQNSSIESLIMVSSDRGVKIFVNLKIFLSLTQKKHQ